MFVIASERIKRPVSKSFLFKKKKDGPSQKQEYVSVFKFPKEAEMRQKWNRAIHRDNWEPSDSSTVCIHHFDEEFIVREDRVKRDDGTELIVARDRLKLTDCAYPTIFTNQPHYMTQTLPLKRKTPAQRLEEIEDRKTTQEKIDVVNNTIHSFAEFKEKHEAKYDNSSYIPI